MFRALRATIRNFLSIGNIPQTIELAIDGLTLILGENLDIGGANSRNGVGKSVILQAVSYGLFGKPLSKIRVDNLVNNINNKDMLVIIEFEYNGKFYRIERGRKPRVLHFFKDGQQQVDDDDAQGDNRVTQTEIERIIGMSYGMFRNIVALNTITTPFLREETSVQRELIEELFGITLLSQRGDALKILVDDTKERLRDCDARVKATIEANGRIETAIDTVKQDAVIWQTKQDGKIKALMVKSEEMHLVDIDQEIALFDEIDRCHAEQRHIDQQKQNAWQQMSNVTQDIERLQKDLTRYELDCSDTGEVINLQQQAQRLRREADQDIGPQVSPLKAHIVRRQQAVVTKLTEAEELSVEITQVDERIATPNSHSCATCGQSLAGTDHLELVVANLHKQRDRLADQLAQSLDDHELASVDIDATQKEINQLTENHQAHCTDLRLQAASLEQDIIEAKRQLESKSTQASLQIAELINQITGLQEQQQRYSDQFESLCVQQPIPTSAYRDRDEVWQLRKARDMTVNQLEIERNKPNPQQTKIDALQSTLVIVDYTDLNALNSTFKHQTFLHKLLTAKDSFIRKQIIEQNLNYLNKRLNHYVGRLGLPHEVVFQSDLTVEISLLGHDLDFEQLSRGEMNRVILGNAWAFRDVWQNLNHPLNLLFIDEMLDQGTDGFGVEAAMDILTNMAAEQGKNIFLISHREELKDRIDKVLTVRKQDQFTKLLQMV